MSCNNWFMAGGKMRWPRVIASVIGGIILVVVFTAAFGFIAQMLWNWLMPSIFGLGEITYYQAFGLMILARLLIGGFGHRGHGGHHKWGGGKHAHKSWHKYDYNDWKHYDSWWKEAGKDSFRTYVAKKNPDQNKKD